MPAAGTMPTQLITFAGSTVAVEFEGDRPAQIVEFLFRDIPAMPPQPPQFTYRLLAVAGSDRLQLFRQDELLYEGDHAAEVADILLGNTCYHLADRSQGGLLFHAAALAWHGHGLLLPGTMGAGKSTLTAWLLGRGFDYLTDELVFIPHGSSTVQAFARPLNLKRPVRMVLCDRLDFSQQAGQMLSSVAIDLVPPELLNPSTRLSEPSLSLILFPRYQAGGEFALTSLTKAQTGLELMQCLVNARNLPEHGFPEITRLSKSTLAYIINYSSFNQIGDRIETILHWLL